MITGINPSETKNYISTKDDKANPTVWKVSALSNRIKGHVTAIGADKPIDIMIEAVAFGLKGFENFKREDGTEISFVSKNKIVGGKTYDVVDESIIEIIPFDVLVEIGGVILNGSKLSEEEAKN